VIGFIIGLFIGGAVGVTVMCCLFVAKEADKEIYNKEKHNG
jgi:gas vesicle protein